MHSPVTAKSMHQHRVEQFMERAGQEVPVTPSIPASSVLGLRAKLILEECMETIEALGFIVQMSEVDHPTEGKKVVFALEYTGVTNIIEVVDGCCDIKVVTTGTLSALGTPDLRAQELIDDANLRKFGPGGYRRDDGKWIKPPTWVKPDLPHLLFTQGCDPKLLG